MRTFAHAILLMTLLGIAAGMPHYAFAEAESVV